MNFDNLPAGASVFLDANTFLYHFTGDPTHGAACTRLLDRIEAQGLQGFTSSHVLGELAHKVMGFEAQQRFGWPPTGVANRLKRHPAEVRQLAWPRRALDEIHAVGLSVLAVEGADVSRAADLSSQFGILTNDAITIVLMRRYAIAYLASLDADFDLVPGITRCTPT